jgi:lysophospholipase
VFDLPGHGLSSGERANVDEFSRYRRAIADVVSTLGSRLAGWQVLAQSTGAAAVMDYLTTVDRHRFERIVLLAPLVRPRAWLRIKATHALFHRFRESVPRDFAVNSNDPEFLRFLPTDPLQARVIPVPWVGALRRWVPDILKRQSRDDDLLVIQGDEDGTVDWRYNIRQVRRPFPNARVEMIAGARHHLANESAEIRSKYLSLVAHYLEAGPQREPGGSATLNN